jgi:NAD+ diphosphatase
VTTLPRLALSRATLDRAAHRRTEPGLVGRLLAEPGTAVLLLDGDRAPILDGPVRLALTDPTAVPVPAGEDPDGGTAVVAFLGEGVEGQAYLLLASGRSPRGQGAPETGVRWADLREVGHLLDDADSGLLTCAVALANWHAGNRHCARCGAATEPNQAGWARSCPACGAEHYPRTDPAVIMAVIDGSDRILLGRQARWPEKRFSTLAGFVEPGEPLEAAVRREVAEEAGIVVGEVIYRGSQPWPFPSSLMLGFRAEALSSQITVDGTELAQARWWTREELALDVATGDVLVPPPVSIARRLIEDWYRGPLTDAGGSWR